MIRTEQLSKYFQTRKGQPLIRAVQDLTLQVNEGEVFGFLGPNGAGKTTTVRMLTSLIAPTAGRAFIGRYELGKDDRQIRQTVGILTESPGMYERLTAEKNLSIYANLYDVPDVSGQVENTCACSAYGTAATTRWAASRRACGKSWPLPARCCTNPKPCSSTNPPAASTRRLPNWCAISSRNSRPK